MISKRYLLRATRLIGAGLGVALLGYLFVLAILLSMSNIACCPLLAGALGEKGSLGQVKRLKDAVDVEIAV